MRALIQRVKKSSVSVDGKTIGSICKGLTVLIGVAENDVRGDAEYLVDKIVKMRIFNDKNDKMNLSLHDIKGSILVISQFTLYADCRKGNRPSFVDSAQAGKARELYEYFIWYLKENHDIRVETGIFAADMKVYIENDGPVTILLDSEIKKRKR